MRDSDCRRFGDFSLLLLLLLVLMLLFQFALFLELLKLFQPLALCLLALLGSLLR